MAKKKVTQIVSDELTPFLEENGYSLFNVEFIKEGKEWFLRVYIEHAPVDGCWPEQAVGILDCEKVSTFLSERLDTLDPIEQNYYLEVSSPGLDRPLLSQADYDRFTGEQVEILLYKAIDGRKTITGILEGLKQGMVIVTDLQEKKYELPLDQVSKTKLTVIF